jgi:hypothetical protein
MIPPCEDVIDNFDRESMFPAEVASNQTGLEQRQKDIIDSKHLYLPDPPFRWILVGRAFQKLALRTGFMIRSDHINKNDSPARPAISHLEIRPLSPTKQAFCPAIQ